jgi:hypothetical protein
MISFHIPYLKNIRGIRGGASWFDAGNVIKRGPAACIHRKLAGALAAVLKNM